MQSPLRISPEICSHISADCNRGDLAILCRVSREFQAKGQRILYRTVDLRNCSTRQIKSWCRAVTRKDHLACLVQSLSLLLPAELQPEEAANLGVALTRCVQLKELQILHQQRGSGEPAYLRSIQWWIISKCPFRLTKFMSNYFETDAFHYRDMTQFWSTQSVLRLLSVPQSRRFPCSDDAQLPNLIALETTADALPLGTRPLERLQVHIDFDSAGPATLRSYAQTLTTLTVVQHPHSTISVGEIVSTIAEAVSNILHFAITQPRPTFVPATSGDSLIPLLTRFQRLESFVLQVWLHAASPASETERLAELKVLGGRSWISLARCVASRSARASPQAAKECISTHE
ncbi:hypothetical protein FB451DRAFT_1289132 [Mycena latifolia]|nr:hypothetical protein FB451DRAFT_1289132 [Mycena latifolia]